MDVVPSAGSNFGSGGAPLIEFAAIMRHPVNCSVHFLYMQDVALDNSQITRFGIAAVESCNFRICIFSSFVFF
jgi:hypothetical protein